MFGKKNLLRARVYDTSVSMAESGKVKLGPNHDTVSIPHGQRGALAGAAGGQ